MGVLHQFLNCIPIRVQGCAELQNLCDGRLKVQICSAEPSQLQREVENLALCLPHRTQMILLSFGQIDLSVTAQNLLSLHLKNSASLRGGFSPSPRVISQDAPIFAV